MREAKSFGRSSVLSRWGLYYCFTRGAAKAGSATAAHQGRLSSLRTSKAVTGPIAGFV